MKRSSTTQSTISVGSKKSRSTRKTSRSQKSLTNTRYTPVKWGFPQRLYIKLRYVENVAATSTTGSFATYAWRANGLFDPNRTGTGHQPMYYDNCAAIWDHFTVLKSYAKITVTPLTQNTTAYGFCAWLDDDNTPPTTFQGAQEQGSSSTKIVAANSNDSQILNIAFDARKIFGGNPLANDNLQGATAGTDPVEEQYFFVGLQGLNLSTQQFNVTAEIVYYVVFDELKTQNEN